MVVYEMEARATRVRNGDPRRKIPAAQLAEDLIDAVGTNTNPLAARKAPSSPSKEPGLERFRFQTTKKAVATVSTSKRSPTPSAIAENSGRKRAAQKQQDGSLPDEKIAAMVRTRVAGTLDTSKVRSMLNKAREYEKVPEELRDIFEAGHQLLALDVPYEAIKPHKPKPEATAASKAKKEQRGTSKANNKELRVEYDNEGQAYCVKPPNLRAVVGWKDMLENKVPGWEDGDYEKVRTASLTALKKHVQPHGYSWCNTPEEARQAYYNQMKRLPQFDGSEVEYVGYNAKENTYYQDGAEWFVLDAMAQRQLDTVSSLCTCSTVDVLTWTYQLRSKDQAPVPYDPQNAPVDSMHRFYVASGGLDEEDLKQPMQIRTGAEGGCSFKEIRPAQPPKKKRKLKR